MSDETTPPTDRPRKRRRRRRGAAKPGDTNAGGTNTGGTNAGGAKAEPGQRQRRARPSTPAADPGGPREGKRRRRKRPRGRDRDDGPRTSDASAPASRPPPRDTAASSGPEALDDLDAGWGEPEAVDDDRGAALADAPPGRPDEPWGDDSDAPTPDIALAADLPPDPDVDDPDPATAHLDDDDAQPSLAPVHNVVGVKFHSAGKIYEFDGAESSYHRGEEVVVETDRGTRIGIVAISSVRRPHDRALKRIVRRPDASDLTLVGRNEDRAREALQVAKQRAKELRLPIKLFRAEYTLGGTKVLLYFSCEGRVDFRQLVRDLGQRLRGRVEMRQTGVRDEAELVGGIGSCGRELCCTTFLPAFAPVSIKMAKDQGLVLNPSKVSGQCGRLKCCLVYEQSTYAEMRKGLPKLGKRVVTDDEREGRVVEVDVLRGRIRVSFGAGEFEVFPAGQVRPLFPPQNQPK